MTTDIDATRVSHQSQASLHRRLAHFHMGGEWFHLTRGVRAVMETVIADDPQ